MQALNIASMGCVDIDIITEPEIGQRAGLSHRPPDALVFRHVSRSGTKCQCVLFLRAFGGIGPKLERGVGDRFSVEINRIAVLREGLESINGSYTSKISFR